MSTATPATPALQNLDWHHFVQACGDKKNKAKVLHIRMIGDRMAGKLVLDYSYGTVEVAGEQFNLKGFPIGNWHGSSEGQFKKDVYAMAKAENVFIKNLFGNLEIFV